MIWSREGKILLQETDFLINSNVMGLRMSLKMTAFGVTCIELGIRWDGAQNLPGVLPGSKACRLRTSFASHALCSAPLS